MQKRRKKKKQRRRVLRVILPTVLLVAALGTVMVWKVFVVRDVEVEGNEIYPAEQIENWVLDDEYSWSSLYVVLKNKFHKQEVCLC